MKYLLLLGALAAFPLISAECIGKNCSEPQVKGYANRLPEKYNANNPENLASSPDAGGDPATNARDALIRATVEGKSLQGRSDEELDNFGNPFEDNSSVHSQGGLSGSSSTQYQNSSSQQGFSGSITVTSKQRQGSKIPEDMCFYKSYQARANRGYTTGQLGDTQFVLGNPQGRGWGYEYSKSRGNAYVGQYNKTRRDGKGYLFFLDRYGNRNVRFAEYSNGKLMTTEQKADIAYWNTNNPNVYLRTLMEHMISGHVLDNHRTK
jgi:hypothetical protein